MLCVRERLQDFDRFFVAATLGQAVTIIYSYELVQWEIRQCEYHVPYEKPSVNPFRLPVVTCGHENTGFLEILFGVVSLHDCVSPVSVP